MSHTRILELIVGAFVILGVLAVFFLTMRVSNLAGQGDASNGGAQSTGTKAPQALRPCRSPCWSGRVAGLGSVRSLLINGRRRRSA